MTSELSKNSGTIPEQYVNKHTYKMLILIEKTTNEEYSVIYANALATEYFFGKTSMSGKHFFQQSWETIFSELQYLADFTLRRTVIPLQVDGEKCLFELSLLVNENHIISIELNQLENRICETERIQDLKENYESVIENNLDTIITVNINGDILKTNLAVQSVFGFQRSALINKSIYNFVQHDQVDLFKLMIKESFSGNSSEAAELNMSHNENTFLPALVKILPISNLGEITELNLILRDLSKYYEYNEKFLFLSYRDQLTGLFNRRSLKKDFMDKRLIAQKNKQKIAIVHVGLDRFKLINDALGHNGADEILKAVGKRMIDTTPKSYKVYRNGGDEFIILVNNHIVGKTEEIACLLLDEFQKPFYLNDSEYYISASIGISVFPDNGINIEKLIQNSEQAMFYVKENGRSHFRFYADEMKSMMSDEVLLESHLRRAIELDELQVYYQPQVDLMTGEINSFEALLRWNNRKFGLVSPGQFIKIAEDSGLIHSIGDWVLNQACIQLKIWQEEGHKDVSVAVNISPKQFRMSGFSRKVEAMIENHQIDPNSLELEITESSLAGMDETLSTLNELKVIGVNISVDDFGTGYSSLSYLKQYPIDIIKIDQSFIKDIEIDEKNEAIAKTIINLAHNLGMKVVAEGVEKQLQAKILLNANCQKAQGYLYSKALPVNEIIAKYFTDIQQEDEKKD